MYDFIVLEFIAASKDQIIEKYILQSISGMCHFNLCIKYYPKNGENAKKKNKNLSSDMPIYGKGFLFPSALLRLCKLSLDLVNLLGSHLECLGQHTLRQRRARREQGHRYRLRPGQLAVECGED